MEDDLPIDARLTVPGEYLSFRAVRSSGPGGQNVNKVSTKVVLRFDLAACASIPPPVKERLRTLARSYVDADGQIAIASEATRSQARNLEDARAKLAEFVRRALVVPKKRRPTRPTLGSKRRRVEDKRKRSETKQSR
ncbi:MAG: aminoacyl-tRNA hydrolase, partial [Polyangiaceae bacterium]|nr:aminoacyl-tRNA hydrolase [Polyangiaceae bacterium]